MSSQYSGMREHSISYFHDFGDGNESFAFKGPKGMVGEMIDVSVVATETFNQVTTPGSIKVGTAGDDDHYVTFTLGALSDGDHLSASETASAMPIKDPLPADTLIVVLLTGPTGGTPAGKAIVTITTGWKL